MQLARETTYLVQNYTLPDGSNIRVAPERFQAPEALFTPDLIDKEGDGISEMIFNCIQARAILHQTSTGCRHLEVLEGCVLTMAKSPARGMPWTTGCGSTSTLCSAAAAP